MAFIMVIVRASNNDYYTTMPVKYDLPNQEDPLFFIIQKNFIQNLKHINGNYSLNLLKEENGSMKIKFFKVEFFFGIKIQPVFLPRRDG